MVACLLARIRLLLLPDTGVRGWPKFTPEGGQIGLKAHHGAAPRTIDLVVRHTARDIAADKADSILKPLAQADSRLSGSCGASAWILPMLARWSA